MQAAQAQAEAAMLLAAKSQSPEAHWQAEITSVRVEVASRKVQMAQSRKRVERIASVATKAGFLQEQFRAQLLLGQVEIDAGEPTVGRGRLAQLEKEAREKGFLLIARKAHSASSVQ